MPQSSSVTPAHETGVSGTRVIRSIRRLIIVAAVAVFGYATFMTASKGACTASAAAEDGYRCATLNLRPSALVSI